MTTLPDTSPSFDQVFDSAWLIVVAGGSGSRMQTTKPKQFLLLDGKPILLQTIDQFAAIGLRKIILVLPQSHISRWDDIVAQYHVKYLVKVVAGGATRTESVINGLSLVPNSATTVGIHDAVRPMVPPDVIMAAYASAYVYGSGVPVVPVKDSIRMISNNGNTALNRASLVAVQTPQVFNAAELKEAYSTINADDVSDDATVWERSGRQVKLTKGDYINLKVTTPEDLIVIKALKAAKKEAIK